MASLNQRHKYVGTGRWKETSQQPKPLFLLYVKLIVILLDFSEHPIITATVITNHIHCLQSQVTRFVFSFV